jgi:hypothetical protein
MIRLTWRQFRAQATVTFGVLAVIAVVLAITGPRLVHLYDTSVVPCQARGDCSVAISAFVSHDSLLQGLDERGVVPLGYAAFAFALGVTAGLLIRRTLPAMIATLAVFAGLRVAVTTWVRPRLLAPLHVVSGLQAPTANGTPGPYPPQAADWVLSDQTVNAAGQVIGQNGMISYGSGRYGILFSPQGDGRMTLQGVGTCPNRFPAQAGAAGGGHPSPAFQHAVQECLTGLRVRAVLTYQPTSHYWPM